MAATLTSAAPNGLRSFAVTITPAPGEDITVNCTLGLQLGGGGAQFCLIRDTIDPDGYDPALWARISSIIGTHPVVNPDEEGRYNFYMKTYSENTGIKEQLVTAGILEESPSPPVPQGFVTFPHMKVRIRLGEMAKQCSNCERWELCTDEARMRGCSRCRPHSKAWYCDEECQNENWREGYPPHKDICGN